MAETRKKSSKIKEIDLRINLLLASLAWIIATMVTSGAYLYPFIFIPDDVALICYNKKEKEGDNDSKRIMAKTSGLLQ